MENGLSKTYLLMLHINIYSYMVSKGHLPSLEGMPTSLEFLLEGLGKAFNTKPLKSQVVVFSAVGELNLFQATPMSAGWF